MNTERDFGILSKIALFRGPHNSNSPSLYFKFCFYSNILFTSKWLEIVKLNLLQFKSIVPKEFTSEAFYHTH